MSIGGHQSPVNKSVVWLTPPEIVRALGDFDLDPCAPAVRPWDTAREHYPERGLELPWAGRIWLNPPYGPPTIIGPWMRTMARHGCGTAIIFARTETAMFFETVWRAATGVLFLQGRLHFHHGDGRRARANAGAPSVLVAYGADDLDVLAQSGIAGHLVPLRLPRGVVVAALAPTWRELVVRYLREQPGPVAIGELYVALAAHPKARGRRHVRAKLRQTLQRGPFKPVQRGFWEAA